MGSSDHDAVLATLDFSLKVEEPVPGRKLYHWSLANWREMNVELSRTSFDFENLTGQESVDLLTNTVKELTEKYVPSSAPTTGRPLPWWTPECEWALRRKQRAFQGGNKKAIMWATKCCLQVCRRAYGKYMERLKTKLAKKGTSDREFWQITKSHSGMTRQRRKAAPPAEDLAKYFAKKMSLPGEESKEVPELEPAPPGARRLRGFKITFREVSKVLQSLDVRKSVGPDGVSPRVLKHCARQLARPLTRLFQKVGKSGEFPMSWKVARVTPVYKKKDASLPENYRPISVLPTLATTFERVLMKQLSSFLFGHIPPNQFGFLPGTGTVDVGVILADTISLALEARKDVRLVALDFKGAFDKVWWRGLLAHLWAVGVRSKAFKLMQSYLSDRALFVVANGDSSSHMRSIKSGVPQGAIWSPLLFDLFIRNVPQRVREALCLFYADDLTLQKDVDREEGAAQRAAEELNDDLQRLYEFGKEWLLEFEPTKSQELIITNSVADHKVTHPPLSMGGVIVEEKEQLEALGFTIDPRGNWSLHAKAVAKEARKRLGAIRRIAHMLDDRAKMMAYKAFVRSKIEYGNLIYWGAAEGYLEKLDRVQSSAVSMLADSSAFFIPSLESRRQAAAVGLTCKLLDGQGRGALSEVQPVFAPPTTKSTRSSDRLAAQRAAGPQHPHQLKAAAIRHTGNRPSLVTYKRSYTEQESQRYGTASIMKLFNSSA